MNGNYNERMTSAMRPAKASIFASSVSPPTNSHWVSLRGMNSSATSVYGAGRLDAQLGQGPAGQRLAIRLHDVARLGNSRHVLVVVGDRRHQRRADFVNFPAGVGLALDFDRARRGAGREALGKGDARQAELFGHEAAGLARAPVARLAADQQHVEFAELAGRGGQRPGHGQRVGGAGSFVGHEHGVVGFERQRLAQHVFGRIGAEGEGRDLAAVGVAHLQGRFQRVFAEDVRHQVRAAALGFALRAVDAKVASRNLGVEDLFQADDDVHR